MEGRWDGVGANSRLGAYSNKYGITELDSKCASGMNEQLLKTSGADVLSSRRKLTKT